MGVRRGRSALGLAALALGLAAPAAAQDPPPPTPTLRIVAFGDSITHGAVGDDPGGGGYPARLQALLTSDDLAVTVINEGEDGETTVQGLSRITTNEGGPDDVLLVMEGTNDTATRRVSTHLDRIRALAGIDTPARVHSRNTFPMGAGIASSASAFAALTAAGCAAAGLDLDERALSILARQGSGRDDRGVERRDHQRGSRPGDRLEVDRRV